MNPAIGLSVAGKSVYGGATEVGSSTTTRDAAEREKHKEKHGYKGPKERLDYLQFFRPFPSETPPVVTALWVAILWAFATFTWFGIALTGYIVHANWVTPLPEGERLNIELIFSTVPLNRWAVNLGVSFISSVSWFFIVLAVIYMRLDRRIRRDLSSAVKRAVVTRDVIGEVDNWDDGAPLQSQQNPLDKLPMGNLPFFGAVPSPAAAANAPANPAARVPNRKAARPSGNGQDAEQPAAKEQPPTNLRDQLLVESA